MSDDTTQMPARPAPKKRVLDRAATEQRLLKAFDKLLCAHGVKGVRVNAVLDEAGVGKALLYRYFGGLGGLAKAWAEQAHLLPEALDVSLSSEAPIAKRFAHTYRAYGDALRRQARSRAFLAAELETPTEVTESFRELRVRFGRKARELLYQPVDDREAGHALAFVVTAAVNYMALRAATQPEYYGLKLNEDAAWDEVERLLTFVSERTLKRP